MWLNENGWQFYDCTERLIHLPSRTVMTITELFIEFKKENPEP